MTKHLIFLNLIFALNACSIEAYQLVGALPDKVTWLIESISQHNQALRQGKFKQPIMLGRLIIHGPPGNGKSTIAGYIAQASNAMLFTLHGPSIVGRYLGQGAETIETYFQKAIAHAEQYQQVAVIVIDEIDAIAGNNNTEFRSEHSAALQKLWLLLDDYKNDPRVCVICTTNNLDLLHKAFIDRFGSNCIEIGYPDAALRAKVLEHYFEFYANTQIDVDLLQRLVSRTDGMSIRCLEDLARDASLAAHMTNNDIITDGIVMKIFDEIEKKWKTHSKDASYMSLTTWKNISSLCNDLTHTARNLCFLYALHKAGSIALSNY